MPCSHMPDEVVRYNADSDKSYLLKDALDDYYAENLSLKKQNRQLEALLCAVFTELDKVGLCEEIATKAQRGGEIDALEFLYKHFNKDKARILDKVHQTFSEHEMEILKDILKD